MMILKKLFGAKSEEIAAEELYRTIVVQSRKPAFYLEAEVPDTVDGRFEMISLNCFLVLRRIKQAGEAHKALSQAVFDRMFQDMDQNIREIGVGDLSVGKHIKKMATAFYGRISSYEKALDGGEETVEEALERNHYGTLDEPPQQESLEKLANYMRENDAFLAEQTIEELKKGRVQFKELA